MAVSPSEIELALDELKRKPYSPSSFFFGFLEAHDAPKATISKIRNSSDALGVEFVWPRKIAFRSAEKGHVLKEFENVRAANSNRKNAPRFVLVSDGVNISGYDSVTDEPWHDSFDNLNSHFNMTLPLAGLERYRSVDENPADVKAAGRLAKFYDAILEANPDWSGLTHRHELNQFMTRVLFCMFAEDTHIIPEDIFTRTMEQNTKVDGSDVAMVLSKVFEALDLKVKDRVGFPSYVNDFPYVNGGLFRDKTAVPRFSQRARTILIEACRLQWAEINPDIFGSMIQGVVDEKKRSELGMHYTSVPNIMKVIGPLFLDDLKAEFEQAGNNVKRLEKLLAKVARIRVFDPACGSGNFLIISYRELRRLENAIFKKLQSLASQSMLPMSQVRLSQFYGIEYADFAAETAKLSLWIAEYQANKEFEVEFGKAPPALPLKDGGNIVRGNAARVDWLTVCPPDPSGTTYIVGNPPYLGGTSLEPEQKEDMALLFAQHLDVYKYLDYVSCWFLKGADYCGATGAQAAFVSTNSICQGEQVGLLWPLMFQRKMEITFAHLSFKWRNNASKNAGVTCVIVGFAASAPRTKRIFENETVRVADNINPYLLDFENVIVYPRTRPLTSIVPVTNGSKPTDDGNLFLTAEERNRLVAAHPEAASFLRRVYGSKEYINGIERWCLWIPDDRVEEALGIAPIARRIEAVREFRLASPKIPTQKRAEVSHKFDQIRQEECEHVLIIPSVYSEKRQYVPCGLLTSSPVVTNLAFAVFDGPIWLLGLLLSRLHAVWIRTVCGQLETRIRYSNTLGYNTFPLIDLSARQQQQIEDAVWEVVAQREAHSGTSIGKLYDVKTMPESLRAAHQTLDDTVERIYRGRAYRDDTERVEHLFRLYVLQRPEVGDSTTLDVELSVDEDAADEDI
ncbi:DNA methyltransferase [Rhizobium sp. MHM7A]|uniref:class I SAM-dependent DNA methyltransferase n=1 Tax=Rhizobium sp. MHM7A TaxID=2583233 RepID=UPI00110733B2|nr:DNA methyltransferase [Rhizobium sp. MHM7A]TLX16769.1 class I SAM-dependent DNA methyltransferase [Rhizobium sp. MHM7A]